MLGMVCCYFDDFIVCVGGEEFVVMLFDLDCDEVRLVVVCVVVMVVEWVELYVVFVVVLYVMLLVGVVIFMFVDEYLDVLLEWVDVVFYDVKCSGCNMFCFY